MDAPVYSSIMAEKIFVLGVQKSSSDKSGSFPHGTAVYQHTAQRRLFCLKIVRVYPFLSLAIAAFIFIFSLFL